MGNNYLLMGRGWLAQRDHLCFVKLALADPSLIQQVRQEFFVCEIHFAKMTDFNSLNLFFALAPSNKEITFS